MSPEFLALLAEGKPLRSWFLFLPVGLGILSLLVSARISGRIMGLVYVTLLAITSVTVPTVLFELWWSELTGLATSLEEIDWIHDHDGGGLLIGPLYASILASVFWFIAALVLAARAVLAYLRRTPSQPERKAGANASS